MRKKLMLVAFIGLIGFTLVGCDTDEAREACLERPSQMVLPDGPLPMFGRGTAIADDTTIDARGSVWSNASGGDYPVSLRWVVEPRDRLCFVGGGIYTDYNYSTSTWLDTWHKHWSFTVNEPEIEIIDTEFYNVGDGIGFQSRASDFKVRGVQMIAVHDDCIENDAMNSGWIDDSFFNGCFSGFSARGWSGYAPNGSGNYWAITNTLVRLQDMPSSDNDVYDSEGNLVSMVPGHYNFFKFSSRPNHEGISPELILHDNVFRVDSAPIAGSLGIPVYDHDLNPATPMISYLDHTDPDKCSNNTIVWGGSGPFPGSFPSSCFTITTDTSVWDDAVADWQAAR